ncbi:MAG: hypothetical protein HOO06_09810 [Bdellovibrionaceae bacterium]|mgnify:CR=1 FL=1|jgi:hypothetical protein|nr:hypothetical protein [Pseudobdellovibrionaceae bacterium]
MNFSHQSYRSTAFRPTPLIHLEDGGDLIIIATAWGSKDGAQKAIDTILEFYFSIQDDLEITSPFENLDCMSMKANHLRTSLRLANDVLRKEYNSDSFQTGVELFIGLRNQHDFIWTQIGQPHILLSRQNHNLSPINLKYDLSLDYSTGMQQLVPLPSELLGIYNTTQFQVNSLKPRATDRLILLSGPRIPCEMLQVVHSDVELNTLVKTLSSEQPNLPFWIGLLNL